MVTLSADHHLSIGYEHVAQGKPCQDHALSLVTEDMACAVISDGCSSGGETDMGARVLTFGTVAAIRAYHEGVGKDSSEMSVLTEVHKRQRTVLSGVRTLLTLQRDDMLATCGYAYLTEGGGVAHLEGDGVIAIEFRDGRMHLCRYDWGNAPFYPQYMEDDAGRSFASHGGAGTPPRLTEEEWVFDPSCETAFALTRTSALNASLGMRGVTHFFDAGGVAHEISSIALFTDGVFRVEGIDWKEAVVELLSFKTVAGQFVKRRLNRALKDFRKIGKGPLDDIAYAVIHVEPHSCEGENNGNANENP